MQTSRSTAVAALLLVPVLALLTPSTDGPLGPLLALVALAAWVGTGWLLLVLALACSSRIPGALGRGASRAARRVAPRPLLGLVAAALGTSLLVTAPAALAEDRTPTVAGSTADSLDWPGLAPVTAPPSRAPRAPQPTTRPAAPSPTPVTAPAAEDPRPVVTGTRHAVPRSVVVAAGDSLWSIAKRSLGAGATDRQVAQAWPRWWAANRALVGDAPELIHPGDRLTAP